MNRKDLILVTGASRGIGRATVKAFIRDGRQVLAAARTEADLLTLREETGCLIRPCDVSREEDVRALFEEIESLSGDYRLRAVVNDAGISIIGLLQDMTLEEWNRILQTNLTSIFLTSRAAIPIFLKNRDDLLPEENAQDAGSIVNVSSVWGNVGASCETAYSATKGAVNAFTKALARELAPSRIRVNAAAFGAIDTDMNRFLTEEDRKNLEEEIGMGRFGTPDEAAALIADLALNHPYLTGQIVTMDGAWV